MKLHEVKATDDSKRLDVIERLPVHKNGYGAAVLKGLQGKFVAFYEKQKVAGPGDAHVVAAELQKYLVKNYPDVKLPLLFHPSRTSYNLDVSDKEGEDMSCELRRVD